MPRSTQKLIEMTDEAERLYNQRRQDTTVGTPLTQASDNEDEGAIVDSPVPQRLFTDTEVEIVENRDTQGDIPNNTSVTTETANNTITVTATATHTTAATTGNIQTINNDAGAATNANATTASSTTTGERAPNPTNRCNLHVFFNLALSTNDLEVISKLSALVKHCIYDAVDTYHTAINAIATSHRIANVHQNSIASNIHEALSLVDCEPAVD